MNKQIKLLLVLFLFILSNGAFAFYVCDNDTSFNQCRGYASTTLNRKDRIFYDKEGVERPYNDKLIKLYKDTATSVVSLSFYKPNDKTKIYSTCSGVITASKYDKQTGDVTKMAILTIASCIVPMSNKVKDLTKHNHKYLNTVGIKIIIQTRNQGEKSIWIPPEDYSVIFPSHKKYIEQINTEAKTKNKSFGEVYLERIKIIPDMAVILIDNLYDDVLSFTDNDPIKLRQVKDNHPETFMNDYCNLFNGFQYPTEHKEDNESQLKRIFLVGFNYQAKEKYNIPLMSYGTIAMANNITFTSDTSTYSSTLWTPRMYFLPQSVYQREGTYNTAGINYLGTMFSELPDYVQLLKFSTYKLPSDTIFAWLFQQYEISHVPTYLDDYRVVDTNTMSIPLLNFNQSSVEMPLETYQIRPNQRDRGSAAFLCPSALPNLILKDECIFIGLISYVPSSEDAYEDKYWMSWGFSIWFNMYYLQSTLFYSYLNPYLRELVNTSRAMVYGSH